MSIEHPGTLVRLQDSLDYDSGNVAIRVPTSGVLYSAPIVAAPVTPGDWSSYTDDFPGSSFGSLWSGGYGTRTVTGNRVRMPTVGYQGQDSVAHDLVDQQIVWKNEPDSTGGYCGATIRRDGGGTVVCTMYSKGGHGTLETEFSNGGSPSTSSITYSATDHLWMRFRHSSTTNQIFMETSPNGTTWTTRASHSISLADVRTVDIQIEAGEFGGSGSGYAYISKLNLPPAGAAIALDGTSSGSSSSSGNLSLANALAGSSNGTSSSTGSLGLATALTATSTGGSTSSGSLRLAMALTGTSAGTSTSDATQLVNLVPLTGNSAGSSTSTAALALAAALTGTSAGTSTSSASLDLGQGLTGSSSGTSTTTGSLVLAVALVATSSGTATSVADLTVAHTIELDGTSGGTSTATGTLTVTPPALTTAVAWRYLTRPHQAGIIDRPHQTRVLTRGYQAGTITRGHQAGRTRRGYEAGEITRD